MENIGILFGRFFFHILQRAESNCKSHSILRDIKTYLSISYIIQTNSFKIQRQGCHMPGTKLKLSRRIWSMREGGNAIKEL